MASSSPCSVRADKPAQRAASLFTAVYTSSAFSAGVKGYLYAVARGVRRRGVFYSRPPLQAVAGNDKAVFYSIGDFCKEPIDVYGQDTLKSRLSVSYDAVNEAVRRMAEAGVITRDQALKMQHIMRAEECGADG